MGRVNKRCNHLLKDSVIQSAFHIGRFGPKELVVDYKRRKAAGQHADFGMGRRFLRMTISLMKTSQFYLSPHLRNNQVSAQERAGYYLAFWPQLRDKWH